MSTPTPIQPIIIIVMETTGATTLGIVTSYLTVFSLPIMVSIAVCPDEWKEFITEDAADALKLTAKAGILTSPPVFPLACAYNHFRIRGMLSPYTDPLVLDLDGDGIKTTNTNGDEVSFFDSNGDGFAEMTGWADAHDGVLAMDKNGNGIIDDGRELFGDQTVLKSGRLAANGFEALTELDSNKDGRIDAYDEAYSQLKVITLNAAGDGYQLRTLEELGIKSINLDSTITNTTDAQGNTQNRLGTFEMADGAIRQIAEYSFQRNLTDTIATEWFPVPDDIAALPDLQGHGTVYSLHQAMVRDSSGELKSLVEQFTSATDPDARAKLMEKILFKWTGTQSDLSGGHPSLLNYINYDDGKIAMLERFFGESFTPPGISSETWTGSSGASSGGGGGGGVGVEPPRPRLTDESVMNLNESYRLVFEYMYGLLMAQTHLKALYEKIAFTVDEQEQEIKMDMSPAVAELQTSLANNPEQGKDLLGEFARSMRGLGAQGTVNYLSFRETFIQQDPSLGWIIDTGGLTVIEHVGQGTWPSSSHMMGTDGSEAIRGSLTEGDGCINGQYGNDVIYGTDRNETLISMDGDSLLFGGGGADQIWAGAGNDILDGGTGNDILCGETGNDTYIFRRGSGQDTIIDVDSTEGNTDTIWLGGSLTTDDVLLRRVGNNLVLKIKDTTDTVTVRDHFRDDSTLNKIEQISFMDGTVWGESDILQKTFLATEGDDILYGGTGNDTISGAGGNGAIHGRGGDDVLHGDGTYLFAGPPVLFGRSSAGSRSVYLKTGLCVCA